MDKLELQKLRELPIEGVAERLGLQVTRHLCLCPFHDDHHASLSFSVRRNTFRCFVCGASGGTIDLVMRVLNLGFREACRWLADEYNMIISSQPSTPLSCGRGAGGEVSSLAGGEVFDPARYERFFQHPWLSPEARRFLFEERLIDERVARWCRLTSWRDKQGIAWLQIPYYNMEGQLTGIQNRNLMYGASTLLSSRRGVGGEAAPRFRFRNGSECGIYNLPVLNRLRPHEPLYITEGCSDCWAMLSAGHKAIAIPSATLLKPKDVEQLSTLNSQLSTEFHMYPDRDEPGERLFLQLKQVLPNLVHHQLPTGCKDFSDYYLTTRRKEDSHGN